MQKLNLFTTFIYILWDPRNNNKCYIGKADNPSATKKTKINGIGNCVNKRNKTAGGFTWEYELVN
jgi:hypothetical protein